VITVIITAIIKSAVGDIPIPSEAFSEIKFRRAKIPDPAISPMTIAMVFPIKVSYPSGFVNKLNNISAPILTIIYLCLSAELSDWYILVLL